MNEPRIWCPSCAWRPRAADRWICAPGCGTHWNTFWTGGVCPGCARRWRVTQCIACQRVAPHMDWYHWPGAHPGSGRRGRQNTPEETG